MDSTQHDSVSITTYFGQEVEVTANGVILITEPGGVVATMTVEEAAAMARTRRSRGVQVGDFNTQNNTFKG